jgi:hypothetical protein
MQRTPAQPAEWRDPFAGQQGPSAEQRSQSAERQNPATEQCSHSAESVLSSAAIESLLRPFPPDDQDDEAVRDKMYRTTTRAWQHLKTQATALEKVVAKAKDSSIRKQVDFFSSAFKDYNCACGKAIKDSEYELRHYNIFETYLEHFLNDSLKMYHETMSLADDFFERREKEKAEALKTAKMQKLQRLADNLIEDEMDAHDK